jgi:methionine-gamma-lyase
MPNRCDTNWAFDSRTVHHPSPSLRHEPVATPIYQSTTFRAVEAASVAGHSLEINPTTFYSRYGNPTTEVLEKVVADLEGGDRALAFASGMAAVSTTLFALLRPGDHVVAGNSLYTATTKLLSRDFQENGIEVDFVDPTDSDSFGRASRPNTRLFYLETPSNPMMVITDLSSVCEIAKDRGIVTVVDNTFATPYNQRPISYGANVVIHSATKYLAGHSDVTAGCVVCGTERAESIWMKRTLLGGMIDPFAAWLVLRGIKTLSVRMERHNRNAQALAEMLASHPAVCRVLYPGLSTHPQHALAAHQMSGFGGMLSFELFGGRRAGVRLVESTRLAVLAVSLGGVETLIEHPASMSHSLLDDDELRNSGIPPGLIRLSVGIENSADLAADLQQAVDRSAE